MKKLDINDYTLIATVGTLLITGLIILASVSTVYSQNMFGNPYHFLTRQIIFILIGSLLGFIAYNIKLGLIKKWSFFILIANLILLAAVFIPGLGFTAGGATRWLQLGPFMVQPAEFLKLSFIIFFSAWIVKIIDSRSSKKRRGEKKNFSDFHPIIICLSLFTISAAILIFQPNISSLAVIFAVTLIIYFLSGTPIWHTVAIFAAGIAGLGLVIRIAPHIANRILVFLEPGYDPMGLGYQIKQASIAIGSGGLFGLGLGMSRQKLGFLPEVISDSIFAVFAEETGFVGSIILVSLFVVFLWMGFKISKTSADKFCSLAAAGITSWITIQAFVNMGAMLGILPLTGIAMPFISYGGSHLVTELVAVGLLLNISKNKNNIIKTT